MKITKSQLKQLIKEEIESINEQDFDGESGAPITARGKAICAKNPACREKFLAGGAAGALGQREPKNNTEEAGQAAQLLQRQWLNFYKALKAVPDEAGLGSAREVKQKAAAFQNDILHFFKTYGQGR